MCPSWKIRFVTGVPRVKTGLTTTVEIYQSAADPKNNSLRPNPPLKSPHARYLRPGARRNRLEANNSSRLSLFLSHSAVGQVKSQVRKRESGEGERQVAEAESDLRLREVVCCLVWICECDRKHAREFL